LRLPTQFFGRADFHFNPAIAGELLGNAPSRTKDNVLITGLARFFWRVRCAAFAESVSAALAINRFDKIQWSGGGSIRFLASSDYDV
jgi:hypothetical protein